HKLYADSIRTHEQTIAKIEEETVTEDSLKEHAPAIVEILETVKKQIPAIIHPMKAKHFYTYRKLRQICRVIFTSITGSADVVMPNEKIDTFIEDLLQTEAFKIVTTEPPPEEDASEIQKQTSKKNKKETEAGEAQLDEEGNVIEQEKPPNEEGAAEAVEGGGEEAEEEQEKFQEIEEPVVEVHDAFAQCATTTRGAVTLDEAFNAVKIAYINRRIRPLRINEEELYHKVLDHLKAIDAILHPPKKENIKPFQKTVDLTESSVTVSSSILAIVYSCVLMLSAQSL
ncbi:MAG: hypothetical protein EZS28_047825, partial [Streblomastix strix]